MLIEEIILKFKEKITVIDEDILNNYINFCLDNNNFDIIEGENHHILPRSIFPEYENSLEFPKNITRLSYSNHLIAHYMLSLSINSFEMLHAFNMMNNFYNKNNIRNLEQYEYLKQKFRSELKESNWSKSMKNKRHMFKDGKFISVPKDEIKKYIELGYELKSPTSDTIWKNNGIISKRVFKGDHNYIDWKLGRLETKSKGKSTWITRNSEKKRITYDKLEDYLNSGWILGSGKNVSTEHYIRIYKDNVNKSVEPKDLEQYLSEGWKKGGFSVFCANCDKQLSSLGKHNHKCKGLNYEYNFYTK